MRGEFVELDTHFGERIVVVRRTPAPFVRVAQVENAIESIARALPVERRSGYAVLIDMRAAPLRINPSLEPAFARYRTETERGFDRVVVVVTTTVGKIRSERLGESSEIPCDVVGSLDEAWALLRGTQ